ncbi:MAG: type II toxin-antitoxin system VapC family toxin [Leptospiraceae bacterium]|nr:type II toxin-antitoxin system VapC family toxin [Leptospiraceae bacterium]
MFLIDTNIISELTKPKRNPGVIKWISEQEALSFSVISYHELRYGINRAKKEQKKKLEAWWNEFLSYSPDFLPIDLNIANIAGLIRSKSESSGMQLTLADSLIAATAIHHNKTLVTRNIADFEKCGLSLLNPFEIII